MNGRKPMMCVTVLQSQPSVSIPTLTMQRTSRPGGCLSRPIFSASSSKPSGYCDCCWLSRGQSLLPMVSSTWRIQRVSSLLALPLSISFCTSEYTQMVFCRPASLRSSGNWAREITVLGGRSSASHSYTIFASFLVLQTMMNTGGRGSSDLAISWRSASHMLPNMVMGVCAYLRTASGLASLFLPPRSDAVSFGRIHFQMLK